VNRSRRVVAFLQRGRREHVVPRQGPYKRPKPTQLLGKEAAAPTLICWQQSSLGSSKYQVSTTLAVHPPNLPPARKGLVFTLLFPVAHGRSDLAAKVLLRPRRVAHVSRRRPARKMRISFSDWSRAPFGGVWCAHSAFVAIREDDLYPLADTECTHLTVGELVSKSYPARGLGW